MMGGMSRLSLRLSTPLVIASALALVLPSPLAAQEGVNWPAFRGSDAVPVASDDARLPLTWSQTENVAWQATVEGLGWSSPVVWGDQIFLTTVVNDGELAEPRMGLYFPFGSPETNNCLLYTSPSPRD